MSDEPVPMLNKPKESTCEAAEQFAENVLGRMNRTHEQFAELNQTLGAPTAADHERLDRFKEEAFSRIEKASGLTFDRETGRCTTPTEERGDARQLRERWRRVCEELGAKPGAEKSQDLLKEAGRIIRGEETGASEVKPTLVEKGKAPKDRTPMFRQQPRFTAKQVSEPGEPDLAKYQVTQNDALERTFFVTITASQQARPKVKEHIEGWCALQDKLPENGGTLHADLNEWFVQ
jgi:hypothetical protein